MVRIRYSYRTHSEISRYRTQFFLLTTITRNSSASINAFNANWQNRREGNGVNSGKLKAPKGFTLLTGVSDLKVRPCPEYRHFRDSYVHHRGHPLRFDHRRRYFYRSHSEQTSIRRVFFVFAVFVKFLISPGYRIPISLLVDENRASSSIGNEPKGQNRIGNVLDT